MLLAILASYMVYSAGPVRYTTIMYTQCMQAVFIAIDVTYALAACMNTASQYS